MYTYKRIYICPEVCKTGAFWAPFGISGHGLSYCWGPGTASYLIVGGYTCVYIFICMYFYIHMYIIDLYVYVYVNVYKCIYLGAYYSRNLWELGGVVFFRLVNSCML